jgi:pimeloyl-ACP methyl ester carboxylesterase
MSKEQARCPTVPLCGKTDMTPRGNGRSESGPREAWTLAQVGRRSRAFWDALSIVNPIDVGASFSGMVALAYAVRHPAHLVKLVLISTEAEGGSHRDQRVARFERFGGQEVAAMARSQFLEVQGHDEGSLDAWGRLALPLHMRTPRDPGATRARPPSASTNVHSPARPSGR